MAALLFSVDRKYKQKLFEFPAQVHQTQIQKWLLHFKLSLE